MDQASNESKSLRPVIADGDWEPHRNEFTDLYGTQRKTLKAVREYFRTKHQFDPSEKQWKNRIKKWNLGKYYKNDEAQRVVAGDPAPSRIRFTNENTAEARERAEKSLKRKRARGKQEEEPQKRFQSSTDNVSSISTNSKTSDTDVLATDQHSKPLNPESNTQGILVKRQADSVPPPPFQITTIDEKLLFGVYNHIHEAFLKDLWDPQQSTKHNAGRQAARSLASELAAGRSFFEKGKYGHANNQWQKAIDCFKNPDLLNTWYHETPIRLLFELGRMVHTKHERVAQVLLDNLKLCSENLPENDSRKALFSVIGELNIHHLRDLHAKAAKCQYNGLATRLDKRHQLLNEVKLNRALDSLWFDANADLSEWMTEISDLDRDLGADNPYSIYFMLLEAYRHVAQNHFDKADKTSQQVGERLELAQKGTSRVDMFRVGLAYRRLGRQYHDKERLPEARTTMATALKHLKNTKHGASVLVEICQLQEAMAHESQDEMQAFIWKSMLENMMNQNAQEAALKASQKRRYESEFVVGPDHVKRPRIYEVSNAQEQQIVQDLSPSSPVGMPTMQTTTIPVADDFAMQQNPYILNQTDTTATYHYPATLSSRQSSFMETSSPLEIGSYGGSLMSRTDSLLETPVMFPGTAVFEEPLQIVKQDQYQQMPQSNQGPWVLNQPHNMPDMSYQQWQDLQMSNMRSTQTNTTIPHD